MKELVECGSGKGYDEAYRVLVDISEAYNPFATEKNVQQELKQFMVGHLRSKALIHRLVEADIWKEG